MADATGRTTDLAQYSGAEAGRNLLSAISVEERLEASPGDFAFAQAITLVREVLHEAGVSDVSSAMLYKVNPNLSFPPRDIESISFYGSGPDKRVEIIMNLMGLHGAGSPLPTYFTEHVAKNQDEPDALRDFFDIFNHRLVSLLNGVWTKYRYYLQYGDGASDELSQRFLGFIGLGHFSRSETKRLNLSRLLSYAGLIAFKGDAAGSLESTLQHYFSHPDVKIIPCIRRRVEIPADQLNRLGLGNSSLSDDCLLGESVQDQTGKFRISISGLDWERFNSFLPNTGIFEELASLVRFVLPSRLKFDVELKLHPEEIRPLKIAQNSVNRLGWSSWLGDNGDGVVLLEPSFQE